jgi:hypothetical protein
MVPRGKSVAKKHRKRKLVTVVGWVPKELRVSLRMRRDGDYDIYIIHELPKEKEASD